MFQSPVPTGRLPDRAGVAEAAGPPGPDPAPHALPEAGGHRHPGHGGLWTRGAGE